MLMFAQIPGAEKAIEAAARQSGWEAVVLVVIILCICTLAGYLVRRILQDSADRENRMAERIDHLENYIEAVLIDTLNRCTHALVESTTAINSLVNVVNQLSTSLNVRPCLWSVEKQAEMVQQVVAKVKAQI